MRVCVTIRDSLELKKSERPTWCFNFEQVDDSDEHKKIVRTLMTSPLLPVISEVAWCSNCGTYWFEHKQKDELFKFGSVGRHLCGDLDRITIPYPQKGLSLAEIEKKEEEEEDFYMVGLDALEIGEKMFYRARYTQHEHRGWECWKLEAGKAELASIDGKPFRSAQIPEFPRPVQVLERAVESWRRKHSA